MASRQDPASPPQPAPAGGGYVLVHHAATPRFPPQRLKNPVSFVGRVAGNDVVLDSINVSRRHAKLIITDLGVTAHDLDSHNGIFLNGKKVRSTPVAPGDLLYVGDVCLQLQRADDDELGVRRTGVHAHDDISEEEEPRARSLAALTRVAPLCAAGNDDDWAIEVVQICRELCDATIAVLVEVHADGDLETPIVIQPDGNKRGPPPVVWPVVQKALATQEAQYSRDLAESPIVDDVKDDDPRAVMAVPIVVDDAAGPVVIGILYVSRPLAGTSFGEVEFETMKAIAALVGMRLERKRRPAEITNVGDDPTVIAMHAKLAAAEEQLSAAQAECARQIERVHALEAENLRLRQQADLERQGQQKRDAEREREAIAKLESSLNEAKARIERLKADVKAEAEKARAAEDAAARAAEARAEADAARNALVAAEAARDAAEAALSATRAELDAARSAVEERQRADALRTALRASVPPTLVDHVEAIAAGSPATTPAHARPLTALYVALSDFDALCDRATPEQVKAALDRFCGAVVARAQANGGRVDQVVGHAHLVVFPADPEGIRGAVRCAIEIDSLCGDEGATCVVAGVHNGNAVAGFFGGDEGVSYVEAGAPVVVARAAVDHAPPSARHGGVPRGVVVSEAVRAHIASDPTFRVTRLGPTWIAGLKTAIPLAVVEPAGERGAP